MTVVGHSRPIGGDSGVAVLDVVAATEGPTVAVLGGVHGDEAEGVVAARMLARRLPDVLIAGRLLIVAPANPSAFAARQRRSPIDDRDLARSFPGREDGTATERIAAALTTDVIAVSDVLVDLHSAGKDYAMPLFAGYVDTGDEVAAQSRQLVEWFGAPLSWRHDTVGPGRSLSAAAARGVPALYVEGGGGGGLAHRDVLQYFEGIERVLANLGMTDGGPRGASATAWLDGADGNVDASIPAESAGWCLVAVDAGDVVAAEDLIAEVLDDDGAVIQRIVAPAAGTVMFLRRRAEITAGDGVVMFGPVPQAPRR